jgi:hypothetical protein
LAGGHLARTPYAGRAHQHLGGALSAPRERRPRPKITKLGRQPYCSISSGKPDAAAASKMVGERFSCRRGAIYRRSLVARLAAGEEPVTFWRGRRREFANDSVTKLPVRAASSRPSARDDR